MSDVVDKTMLVVGDSGFGKTTALRTLPLGETIYINVDKKTIPFNSSALYKHVKLESTGQLINGLIAAEEDPQAKYIVIDTLTFLGDLFFTEQIENSANKMEGWGKYKSYINQIIDMGKSSNKHYIFLAHAQDVYDEKELITKTFAKIQGSLKGGGLEAHFTFVFYAKVLTDADGMPQYKFQTNKTKGSTGVSAKTPMGCFSEAYIDNDVMFAMNTIDTFYGGQ